MIRKLLVFLTLCLVTKESLSQHYDILTYNLNNAAANGIKIKTNMPFTNGTQMPTLIIEGYSYGTGSPIGLLLTYYVYQNAFVNTKVSSYGTYIPRILLANEAGKVVIFINSKDYYLRLNIKAFAQGMSAETAANFAGWIAVDEGLSAGATAISEVPYQNRFSGSVGIGDASPAAGLHVSNTMLLPNGEKAAAILGTAYNHWTYFGSAGGGKIRGSNEGYLDIETNPNGTNKTLYINTASSGNILMATGGGKVGIGTINPGSFKLAVEGAIGARKVKVTQQSWADFVFAPDYQLPSLQELEDYIHKHRHLPDIPSEKEVLSEGIDLGEMNRKLLQKVEELTLHIIDLNKRLNSLENRNCNTL